MAPTCLSTNAKMSLGSVRVPLGSCQPAKSLEAGAELSTSRLGSGGGGCRKKGRFVAKGWGPGNDFGTVADQPGDPHKCFYLSGQKHLVKQ